MRKGAVYNCSFEAVEKLSFFEQPLDRNHAFDRIPKKKRALQAHFFFPCINSEIHKVNCRIAAREGGLGHAPGIYEFAKQIRLNACCRTKHKNQILLFRQAKGHTFQYVPNCKRFWWICPVPYTLFTTFSRTSDSLGLRTAISATRW